MSKRVALALALSIVVCLGIGALGGLATASSVGTWFLSLEKPSWNPPSSVFGPVWTTLYVMMAVSYWLVWQRQGFAKNRATVLFGAQLLLNLAWSILFFGLQQPAFALAEILVLWVAILLTTLEFRKHSKPAALMLVPYLAWVSFASCLNAAIAWLNR